MPQSSDVSMPQSSDVTMPQSSDVTMPNSSDETKPQSFDVTMPKSSDETMPQSSDEIYRDFERYYPFRIYSNTNTNVFWDVEDYPIPNGLDAASIYRTMDPASIYRTIKEAIKKQGCLEEVSIQAYVDKNTFSDELQHKYSDAGFKTTFFPEGNRHERAYFMLFDIILWVYENPSPSNLIVLSKNIIGEDMLSCFHGLHVSAHFGILLSQTQRSVLFLTSLFDGAKPSGSSQLLDNKKRKIDDILPDSDD